MRKFPVRLNSYSKLLCFRRKKWYNDPNMKHSTPHIHFFTVLIDFPRWRMFILSPKIKRYICMPVLKHELSNQQKTNLIQEQFISFQAMKHFNCKLETFRIIIREWTLQTKSYDHLWSTLCNMLSDKVSSCDDFELFLQGSWKMFLSIRSTPSSLVLGRRHLFFITYTSRYHKFLIPVTNPLMNWWFFPVIHLIIFFWVWVSNFVSIILSLRFLQGISHSE